MLASRRRASFPDVFPSCRVHTTKGRACAVCLLIALASTLLVLPASADAGSGLRLRGTVTDKDAAAGLVTVASPVLVHVLRVPGSLAAIRIGQRVELRHTTLRRHGRGSRVLARGVLIVSARSIDRDPRDDLPEDDEQESRGRITSLSPLTVAGLTCDVPAQATLEGFRVGDVVEVTCDLIRGVWTLRKIHLEDEDEVRDEDDATTEDDGDRRGGHDDDDHGGNSGPGGGDDSGGGSGRG